MEGNSKLHGLAALPRARWLLERYVQRVRPWELDGTPAREALARLLGGAPLAPWRQMELDELDAQLAQAPLVAPDGPLVEVGLRLEQAGEVFRLSQDERDLLVLLLAPDLVPEAEELYWRLLSRPGLHGWSESLLLHVLDPAGERGAALRAMLAPGGALLRQGLASFSQGAQGAERAIALEPWAREALASGQKVLGERLRSYVVPLRELSEVEGELIERLLDPQVRRQLQASFRKRQATLMSGASSAWGQLLARQLASLTGVEAWSVALGALLREAPELLPALQGQSAWWKARLWVRGVDALGDETLPMAARERAWDLLAHQDGRAWVEQPHELAPQVYVGLLQRCKALPLTLAPLSQAARKQAWSRLWASFGWQEEPQRVAQTCNVYPLGVEQIQEVLTLAHGKAGPHVEPSVEELKSWCERLLGQRMGGLASRIHAKHRWQDVVLPPDTMEAIQEFLAYIRYAPTILQDWGYGRSLSYGLGVVAMFNGPSGTGKTMVASLLAHDLGREIYRIDLSKVVSKYIGETEEKISILFDEAAVSGAILLFDEADSLFAKRTEVKSSTDRYANLEVNYLLQRLESHEGVVILTSNNPELIDEAFLRRIRYKIYFPRPGAQEREELWRRMIPREAPQEDDLRLESLSQRFELSGGEIRNAVLRAALYAIQDGGVLMGHHLVRSAESEYRQIGRLVL